MEVDRSFAFVDLCGFTAYTEHHGSVPATQMLAAFRAATRDIASRRGVRIAKWLGDGAMIVGVEPQPVLELLLEVEHRAASSTTLALRHGVTYGKAILFEGDDYIGSVVNLAKRLCDAAEPHEILVGPGVEAFPPPWADVHDVGEVPVKGFDDPLRRQLLRLRPTTRGLIDPICGLPIDPELAFATTTEKGETVVFCSSPCKVTWEDAPTPGLF